LNVVNILVTIVLLLLVEVSGFKAGVLPPVSIAAKALQQVGLVLLVKIPPWGTGRSAG
jgi:hypothetical protein